MKMTSSYIINVYINIFDKQKWWGKEGKGIKCLYQDGKVSGCALCVLGGINYAAL